MKNATQKVKDSWPKLMKLLDEITQHEVMVGVPADTTERKDDAGMTNAQIAYIMDNGAPEANIPARPFMKPGIKNVQPNIAEGMGKALRIGSAGGDMDSALGRVGTIAQNSIRNVIRAGIAPPLSPATIRGRKYARGTSSRRKAEKQYMELIAQGVPAGDAQDQAGIVPLINTGQMLKSIIYVLRRTK